MSLEWATSCPPPRHNFTELPRIRSERPAFDAAHPELADIDAPVRKNILDDAIGGPTLGKRN
jgi:cytochrome c oxidase subunit 1